MDNIAIRDNVFNEVQDISFMELDATQLNGKVDWGYIGGFAAGAAGAAAVTAGTVVVLT